MLDVDHGTYPYVTSSNSSGVGVSAGSGVPGRWIGKVIGVAKCYTTRVGGGPFPTEQANAAGDNIRKLGNEFGTTTGRPRRCGWFDAVAVRYAARLSGVDVLSMMMLDVLSQLDEIHICVAYELDGKRIDRMPSQVEELQRVKPVYERIPAWTTDVTGVRRLKICRRAPATTWRRSANLSAGRSRSFPSGPIENRRFSSRRAVSDSDFDREVPKDHRPRHIAVIMDGNGRWASRRNLPRIEGHRRGVASVRRTVEESARLEIEQLTLYCLSSENWKRPPTSSSFSCICSSNT